MKFLQEISECELVHITDWHPETMIARLYRGVGIKLGESTVDAPRDESKIVVVIDIRFAHPLFAGFSVGNENMGTASGYSEGYSVLACVNLFRHICRLRNDPVQPGFDVLSL